MQTPVPFRTLSARPLLLVDQWGVLIGDPDGNLVGMAGPLDGTRIVYALPTNVTGGALARRYRPPHPPAEQAMYGMDFSYVIPLGVGITSGTLLIQTNVVPPGATTDWTIGAVTVRGRALYANLSGGVAGTDYILTWTAMDTAGNIWPRAALALCAATS